jgi:beta-xylosidase
MNTKRKLSLLLTFVVLTTLAWAEGTIKPGQLWPDTEGKHINAHGGGILIYKNKYYWFGEYKSDNTSNALVGVTCYSSSDLAHWRNEGVAMRVSTETGSEIEQGCIIERPKVIYNPKTGKFVMWFHLELKDRGYRAARAAVAVSDKVTGPYRFVRSQRVNAYQWPSNFTEADMAALDTLNADNYKQWWTPQWRKAIAQGLFLKRDFSGGQMSRDMTLFVDDNGKAYHVFASEDNLTIQIAELNSDYTAHNGRYVRVAAGGQNEAPALFKHDGKYWMITSGCTGWDPNEARMFSADSLFGTWTQHPNPCVGPNAHLTFGAQSTYVLHDHKGRYIFMADIWRPQHPSDARYVWLPISFDNGVPVVKWQDEWKP